MILFINVCLTEKRISSHRPVKENRVDIFKYMISSLSVLPFVDSYIYCSYYDDENLKERKEEVNKHIEKELSHTNLHIYNYRNEYQPQWQNALQPILAHENNAVWFLCNDDHIFIDSNLDTVNSAIDIIENSTENIAMYLSHWPEVIKNVEYFNQGKFYNDKFKWYTQHNSDSVMLLHKENLRKWWFDHDYRDLRLFRTDSFGNNVTPHEVKLLIPLREQCRHFEGYGHVYISEEECPPLSIPDGFFSGQSRAKIDIEPPLFWESRVKSQIENLKERRLKLAYAQPNRQNLPVDIESVKKAYGL